MKKFLAVVLAAALALSLVACGGAPASSGASSAGSEGGSTPASTQSYDYKIGVVTPSGDHGFTGESVAQANLMAEEMMAKYPGMEITVRDGIDAAAQIEAIENLLASGDMDMIILWPMEGEIVNPEGCVDAKELREQLGMAIDSLNEQERHVLSLYYYENLTMKEIGGVLGVSEQRIGQINRKLIQKLRNKLEQYMKG